MNIISRINDLLAQAQLFCLATVISSNDEAIPPGHKSIVFPGGILEYGTGHADVDELIRSRGQACLKAQKKQTSEIRPGLKVFFDIISAQAHLVICGAGHIAIPLARFAREVGFSVTVLDDRPDFADQQRFPECEVIAKDFIPALRQIPINRATFIVIITRGHEHDTECLTEIIPHETAYIGLIGSRRRVSFVLELLAKKGIPAQRLADVCTPIGIPIGAESPEEIALSIAAELVCVRRKGVGQAKALSNAVLAKAL
ncbi:MAG: XdhC family protein [Proteobacteria bacterium]|nr:XdhC family protein [Pseudomonadota bacterium]